jgi:flagellar protein FlgJ
LAINPPSDIVLDVARAVDPVQYSAAVEKLGRAGRASLAPTEAFSSLLPPEGDSAPSVAAGPPAVPLSSDPSRADLRGRLAGLSVPSGKAAEPLVRFESFVLQSFVQSMLPKDAESVFGGGLAGDMWSSLLAEQIAAQMAEAGGIGIAKQIAAAHPEMAPSYRPSAGSARLDVFRPEAPGTGSAPSPAAPAGFVAALELGFADAVLPGRTPDARSGVGVEG